MSPIPIVFDTDMDTDCDDAGALALIHGLARRGEARLVAAVCDAPSAWGPACIEAINLAYGAAAPIGSVLTRHPLSQERYEDYRQHLAWFANGAGMRLYNEIVARRCGVPRGEPLDAVDVYRRALAGQADGSVVIVAVGMLTALADLLDSPPDAASPFDGAELIARKVRMLVSMGGGTFPAGYDGFNWRMDRGAAMRVLNRWPSLLVVNELGGEVLTGGRLSRDMPDGHPVRLAYETFLGGPERARSSWDLITALYAIRGAGSLLAEGRGHRLEYLESGEHRWVPSAGGPERRFLRQVASADEMARELDELLSA